MRAFVPALVPLGIGLFLALLWQSGITKNPIIFLRMDVGTLMLTLGLLASGGVLIRIGWLRSSRRRIEQELAQFRLEQAYAHHRFMRRLDHELKNPLTAIRAGLANLDQSNGHALPSVRAQVDRLARLSADLRKLAEMENQSIEVQPVDLAELLTELVESARQGPEAAKCQIRLVLPQAPWPLARVAGDTDLLLLAIHNLLDNAFKFSRPGDTIEVRAFEDGHYVVAEVADTGPGVGDEEVNHLGEELYRASAAMSVEGSGLGLALVRAITAKHDGAMSIRSREGKGTVVTLRLPAAR